MEVNQISCWDLSGVCTLARPIFRGGIRLVDMVHVSCVLVLLGRHLREQGFILFRLMSHLEVRSVDAGSLGIPHRERVVGFARREIGRRNHVVELDDVLNGSHFFV